MPAISTRFALEQRPVTTVAWWEHVMNLATTWNRGHGPLLQAFCQASRGWSDPAGVSSGIAGVAAPTMYAIFLLPPLMLHRL
jgi:hypothetical protein